MTAYKPNNLSDFRILDRIDTLEKVNRSLTYDKHHAFDELLDLRRGEYVIVTSDGVWCNYATYEDAEKEMLKEEINGVILHCAANYAD